MPATVQGEGLVIQLGLKNKLQKRKGRSSQGEHQRGCTQELKRCVFCLCLSPIPLLQSCTQEREAISPPTGETNLLS